MPPVTWMAAAIAAGLGYTLWVHGKARNAVERWARQHRYRLRRCSRRWITFGPLASPSERGLSLNWRGAPVIFRVEVEDLELGGTGQANVRCWVGWWSSALEEVETDWIRMPVPAAAESAPSRAALPERWDDAQIALLRRVAAGESSFRPADRYSPEAGKAFDELVEHLLALRQRGLLRFPEPLANGRPTISRYAAVDNVELTDEGARIAARRR